MELKNEYIIYINKLIEKYPEYDIGCSFYDSSCNVYFNKDKNDYGTIYLDYEDDNIVASFDFCKTDKRLIFNIASEFGKLCENLDEQFKRWGYFYDMQNKHKKQISKTFSEFQKKLERVLKMKDIKINYNINGICCMANVNNKNNEKHIMYRLEFTPLGYTATAIYDEPHDKQTDYEMDSEFEEFVEDLKRNLGINEKEEQKS